MRHSEYILALCPFSSPRRGKNSSNHIVILSEAKNLPNYVHIAQEIPAYRQAGLPRLSRGRNDGAIWQVLWIGTDNCKDTDV